MSSGIKMTDPTPTRAHGSERIKVRIFITVLLAVAVLLGVFVSAFYRDQNHSSVEKLILAAITSTVLLTLFYVFLRRIDRALTDATQNLRMEIDEHHRTQDQLHRVHDELEHRVEERTRELQSANTELKSEMTRREQMQIELDKIHKQLLTASRLAGMSEVATGVLHNVGNVLNSVNVSACLISDGLKKSRLTSLSRAVALMEEHSANLGDFFTNNPKGAQLVGFLSQLNDQLAKEQRTTLEETESLRKNIEHIKDIVSMQQSYAKMAGVSETLKVTDLMEDALRMNEGALQRHGIEFIRDYPATTPDISTDRHRVLQILVNLIRNAKYACDDSGRPDKKLTLQVRIEETCAKLAIIDNGIGIPPENMAKIFNHGFTTRKDGHGFGLHSGALAAKEMNGSLTVQSEGSGKGATFTLILPLNPVAKADSSES